MSMRCDERYRSRLAELTRAAPPVPGLLPATLTRTSWCPASAGCRELHFDVAGTPWSWCFPSGPAAVPPAGALLVMRPGAHGLIAQSWPPPGSTGLPGAPSGLDLASAAAFVMSGCPIFVHQSLVDRAGRGG